MAVREGDGTNPRSLRDASRVGYHLSQSHGYRVVTRDDQSLGVIERFAMNATPSIQKRS